MKMIKLIVFFLINSIVLIILNSIYDYPGRYFELGIVVALTPNIIGLVLNIGLINVFNKPKFLYYLRLFVVNEIAFSLFEKRFILFGLIEPKYPNNIIAPDNNYYIFISSVALLAILILFIWEDKINNLLQSLNSNNKDNF